MPVRRFFRSSNIRREIHSTSSIFFRLTHEQRRCGERMAGVATESLGHRGIHLPENASAVRAVYGTCFPRPFTCATSLNTRSAISASVRTFLGTGLLLPRGFDTRAASSSHLRQGHAEIDTPIVEHTLRHAGIGRIPRVLHHGHTAAPLDGDEARRAVVEHAGQHDADDARAMRDRGRSKERIDGGPVSILTRAPRTRILSFLSSR